MNENKNILDMSDLSNYEIYKIKVAISAIDFHEIEALSEGDIIYECFKRTSVKTRIISKLRKGEVECDGKKYGAWDWKAEVLEVYNYKWNNGTYYKIRVDCYKEEIDYRISDVPWQGKPKLYHEDIYKYLIEKE